MPSARTIIVDGVPRLVPDDPPAAPKNPPLAALNASYREADQERRDEAEETIGHVAATLRNNLSGRAVMARRTQKPLRAPLKA